MNTFALLLISAFLVLIKFTNAAKMVYEFGFDEGDMIYSKDGIIPLLKYETTVKIPVPDLTTITYIKVTVNALSPPKVDYDFATKQVFINYTWTQITASSYNILVKGATLKKPQM